MGAERHEMKHLKFIVALVTVLICWFGALYVIWWLGLP